MKQLKMSDKQFTNTVEGDGYIGLKCHVKNACVTKITVTPSVCITQDLWDIDSMTGYIQTEGCVDISVSRSSNYRAGVRTSGGILTSMKLGNLLKKIPYDIIKDSSVFDIVVADYGSDQLLFMNCVVSFIKSCGGNSTWGKHDKKGSKRIDISNKYVLKRLLDKMRPHATLKRTEIMLLTIYLDHVHGTTDGHCTRRSFTLILRNTVSAVVLSDVLRSIHGGSHNPNGLSTLIERNMSYKKEILNWAKEFLDGDLSRWIREYKEKYFVYDIV